jgi:hypothetical protein
MPEADFGSNAKINAQQYLQTVIRESLLLQRPLAQYRTVSDCCGSWKNLHATPGQSMSPIQPLPYLTLHYLTYMHRLPADHDSPTPEMLLLLEAMQIMCVRIFCSRRQGIEPPGVAMCFEQEARMSRLRPPIHSCCLACHSPSLSPRAEMPTPPGCRVRGQRLGNRD